MDNKQFENESRRGFIKRAMGFAIAAHSVIVMSNSCQAQTKQRTSASIVGGACEGCEGIYEGMPSHLSWQTSIVSAGEPGERMEISGVIYKQDGRTPAPAVILYVYHTDATGHYSPAPNATGIARRHGRLRGWMRTNKQGEYKFMTIKPAPYPNREDPAHIHPIVKESDKNEYYIDEYVFDDDRLLTREKRAALEERGGSGVIHLIRSEGGLLIGKRNIILGLNVPDYK